MYKGILASAAILLILAPGCQTAGPRVLSIPTARDYKDLPNVSLESAEAAVAQARSAGTEHTAPYEYFSAEEYLRMAQRVKGDAQRDYSALAQNMAEAAVKKGTLPQPSPALDLSNEQLVREAFDRLTEQYKGVNQEKAIAVAPVLYARATTGLSRAEYFLGARGGWKDAAKVLPGVQADLDTIKQQDSDGDKIPDMADAAPFAPEDVDGFQDDDGAPDLDNDNDGIPDTIDREPMVAETPNRWHDFDGAADQYPTLDPVYFAEGSTALSPDAQGYLHGIKVILDEWPELKLHIKGYSDNLHSDVYSMDLSQRRAQEVQRCLKMLGAPENRLIVTSHGQAGDATPDATLANRVELSFE